MYVISAGVLFFINDKTLNGLVFFFSFHVYRNINLIALSVASATLGGKWKYFILVVSLFLFILGISVLFTFNTNELGFQFLTSFYLFDICLLLGVDSVSICFITLTAVIIPLCILFGYNRDSNNLEEKNTYISIFILLEILLIFVFVVLDLVAFYLVFEFILIPFYLVMVLGKSNTFIRCFKQTNRKMHAFFLLFFYTVIGSLILLVGIMVIYSHTGTTVIPLIWYYNFNFVIESLLWFVFFISFSIKIPIVPLHVWLPEAHVESPTEGSVILASILLKIGTYGMVRILIPSFYDATVFYSILVWCLCIVSIITTSMSACVQLDIKRVIAYASIGHMNVCVLGLFSSDVSSISGTLILLVAHGFTSAGLFFCIGYLYSIFHTKNSKYFSGIIQLMPIFSFLFFIFIISNFSIPGTLNFVGEFLIFTSFFTKHVFFVHLCIFVCVFLSSLYSILLYNRIVFANPNHHLFYNIRDLSLSKFTVLIILISFIIILGVYPVPLSGFIECDLNHYFFCA